MNREAARQHCLPLSKVYADASSELSVVIVNQKAVESVERVFKKT